jgi:hypothetical protein
VLYAFPSSPRGMVIFFHSAAGNDTEIYENAAWSLASQLYDDGYGIVALDSDIATLAGTGGWGDGHDDETLDLAATRELVYYLGYWDIPIVAWGVGSGGNFAHTIGMMRPADAVLSFCAPGRRFTDEYTDAPTAWFLAERDSYYPDADDLADLAAAGMEARGIETAVYVHPPTPLYDERFTRVSGIDAATSTEIADAIRAAGYVDSDGEWLVTGDDAASVDLSSLGLTTAQKNGVKAEIRIMAADGVMYDDYAAEVLDFLDGLFP